MGLNFIHPVGYIDFINLMANARIIFTDSGGIQEETTILKIPCITIRKNTERPITIIEGTNMLVDSEKCLIVKAAFEQLKNNYEHLPSPKLWDGEAAKRIVKILSANNNLNISLIH